MPMGMLLLFMQCRKNQCRCYEEKKLFDNDAIRVDPVRGDYVREKTNCYDKWLGNALWKVMLDIVMKNGAIFVLS